MVDLQLPSPKPPPPHLSHVRFLHQGLETAQPQRKRDRTRARLIWATAYMLAQKGPDRLRAPDIAALAGVSPGAFYSYFTDRDDAAQQVLAALAERFYVLDDPAAPTGPAALQEVIERQLAMAQANGGLLRALEATPRLERRLAERRGAWIGEVSARLRASPCAARPPRQADTGAALDAMLWGASRRLSMRGVVGGERERLARSIAAMWAASLSL